MVRPRAFFIFAASDSMFDETETIDATSPRIAASKSATEFTADSNGAAISCMSPPTSDRLLSMLLTTSETWSTPAKMISIVLLRSDMLFSASDVHRTCSTIPFLSLLPGRKGGGPVSTHITDAPICLQGLTPPEPSHPPRGHLFPQAAFS